MASRTIYPYGTGGDIPSGIPIINDLATGGADKALSAEQGKILNQTKVGNEDPTTTMTLQASGNDLLVMVDDAELTLDSVAYEGMTFRELFETNNLISFTPGFESGNYGTYVINAGSPIVTTEDADSGDYSLKASGTTSSQIASPATASGGAFIASRVKITSWTAGYCGVQYGSGATNHDAGISGVTDGWVTVVGEKTNKGSNNIYIGSFISANLTGYVDTPVVIFKSHFTNVPTKDKFTELYNKYVSIKKGNSTTGTRTIYIKGTDGIVPSAENCKSAFVSAMNAKATYIGATTATFQDASGLVYTGAVASATDMLRILVHAAGIPQIAEKWNKNEYDIVIKGLNARTETIETSVYSSSYDESSYPILGGKTGTITATGYVNYNLMWCAHIAGTEVACVLIGDSNDTKRWNDAQKIAVYVEKVLTEQSATLSVDAPCVAVCKLPPNPIMYDNFPFTLIASKSPTTTRTPASLTKVMSLILAYDYITDENDEVEIIASDIIGGSGDNLQAGDVVTIRDLVYDMLLPSSNDAATALARYIGAKILGY